MDVQERMLAELPIALFKFLDTLTGEELNQLDKLDPQLLAKVYQAGAVFSIDTGLKLAKEDK